MVEHIIRNDGVAGSIPATSSNKTTLGNAELSTNPRVFLSLFSYSLLHNLFLNSPYCTL